MALRKRGILTTTAVGAGITLAALFSSQLSEAPLPPAPLDEHGYPIEAHEIDDGDVIQANPFPDAVQEIPATQKIVYRYRASDWVVYPRNPLRNDFREHKSLDGFAIRPDGRATLSKSMALVEALNKLETKVNAASLGSKWYLVAVEDKFNRSVFRLDRNPTAYLATSGNDAIDIVVGTTVAKFPDVTNLGIFVCKKISGSSTYSQHSWANAVDFGSPYGFGSPRSVVLLDSVANYIQRLWDQGWLPVAQLGWRNWDGHYPGHMHISGDPMRSGIPPCA